MAVEGLTKFGVPVLADGRGGSRVKPEKQKIVSAAISKPKLAKWNATGTPSWAVSAPLKPVAKNPMTRRHETG